MVLGCLADVLMVFLAGERTTIGWQRFQGTESGSVFWSTSNQVLGDSIIGSPVGGCGIGGGGRQWVQQQ